MQRKTFNSAILVLGLIKLEDGWHYYMHGCGMQAESASNLKKKEIQAKVGSVKEVSGELKNTGEGLPFGSALKIMMGLENKTDLFKTVFVYFHDQDNLASEEIEFQQKIEPFFAEDKDLIQMVNIPDSEKSSDFIPSQLAHIAETIRSENQFPRQEKEMVQSIVNTVKGTHQAQDLPKIADQNLRSAINDKNFTEVISLLRLYKSKENFSYGGLDHETWLLHHCQNALADAVQAGDLSACKNFIEWVKTNYSTENSSLCFNRFFHQAIEQGKVEIVKLFLDQEVVRNKIDSFDALVVSSISSNHFPPLYRAADCGYADIVQVLLAYGANPNQQTMVDNTVMPAWYSALHIAAINGNAQVIAALLADSRTNPNLSMWQNPFRPNEKPALPNAGTALQLAVENGHIEAAKLLRQRTTAGQYQENVFNNHKPKTKLKEKEKEKGEKEEPIFFKNENEAKAFLKNFEKQLTSAIEELNFDLALQLLTEFSTNRKVRAPHYKEHADRLLHFYFFKIAKVAVEKNKENDCQKLIDWFNKIPIDSPSFGYNASYIYEFVYYFIKMNNIKLVEFLLQLAIVKIKINDQYFAQGFLGFHTALSLAAGLGHIDIVNLLLKEGATLNFKSKPSPLNYAAAGGHTAVIQALLEKAKSVDVDCSTRALRHAIENNHVEAALLLQPYANTNKALKMLRLAKGNRNFALVLGLLNAYLAQGAAKKEDLVDQCHRALKIAIDSEDVQACANFIAWINEHDQSDDVTEFLEDQAYKAGEKGNTQILELFPEEIKEKITAKKLPTEALIDQHLFEQLKDKIHKNKISYCQSLFSVLPKDYSLNKLQEVFTDLLLQKEQNVGLNHHRNPSLDRFFGIKNTRSWRAVAETLRRAAEEKLFAEVDAAKTKEEKLELLGNALKMSIFTVHRNNSFLPESWRGNTSAVKHIKAKIYTIEHLKNLRNK